MPTIKDIAREAGVSCGTVSNVLNQKGNVRAEKIKRVEEAIRCLGYEVNESAKTLRRQVKQTVAVLVPNMRSRHYIELYEALCTNLRPLDYDVEIYSTDNLYELEERHIRKMISANVTGIVAMPTYVGGGALYNKIPESIYLALVGPRPRSITRSYLHVSFDYEQIANDISDHVLSNRYKNAAIFIDSVRFSDTFKYIIRQRLTKAGVAVSTFGSTGRTAVVRAFEMLDRSRPYDVIIASNTPRARAVWQAYASFLPNRMPEIITLSASNTIFEDEYTCVFLNYYKLGTLVADILIDAMVKGREINTSFILNTEGIKKKPLSIPHFHPLRSLNILAAEDSCTGALPKILPQFEQKTGLTVNLSYYPRSPSRQEAMREAARNADVLIADIGLARQQTGSLFLSRADAPALWERLHQTVDASQTYFPQAGAEHLCLSFNTACQMLFCRKDLLREQSLRRRYYERFYRELEIPAALEEFDQVAQFFAQDTLSSEQLYGVSMSSLDADSFWDEFFGRLAAAGLSLSGPDGKLSLCRPALTREIRRYFQLLRLSNVGDSKHTRSAVDEFVRGGSILSVFSTTSGYLFNDNQYGPIVERIACRDVPGGRPIVSSNAAGIQAGTPRQEEALAFLQWMFHDSICDILTLLSGQPIRRPSTQNTEILELYPWLKHFNRNVESGLLAADCLPPGAMSSAFRGDFITALTNAYISPERLEPVLAQLQTQYGAPEGGRE